MELLIQIIKTLLVGFYVVGAAFAYVPEGGDFPPSDPAEPGDPAQYLQIAANDEGFDVWQPVDDKGRFLVSR